MSLLTEYFPDFAMPLIRPSPVLTQDDKIKANNKTAMTFIENFIINIDSRLLFITLFNARENISH